ncbi:aminotransferase class I/II-fold pyridoxal phosphate-dependent enzyme [Oligoflexia bacterium]|nr:aminotransferase class I/II-fold pyridoxal phosphate-dependent enzyme [Oligoflexia bacterium]
MKVNRCGTSSVKWDHSAVFHSGVSAVNYPLWIAEMDFAAPREITEAIIERASVPHYGYTWKSNDMLDVVCQWICENGGEVSRSWITSSPGILNAIAIAIKTFSDPGDSIITDAPIYSEIHRTISNLGRKVIFNELLLDNDCYKRTFEKIQAHVTPSTKLYITCNPNNPTGKAYSRDELIEFGEFCERNDLLIISDEIYSDLCLSRKHTYMFSLPAECVDRSITCLSPTKTFCLSGMQIASIVIPNKKIRNMFVREQEFLHLALPNVFAPIAQTVAYSKCDYWLHALKDYLGRNITFAIASLRRLEPHVSPIEPDGTFMLWIDCNGLKMTTRTICDSIYDQTKILVSNGEAFGPNGRGFIRICVGVPFSVLEELLEQLVSCLESLIKDQ